MKNVFFVMMVFLFTSVILISCSEKNTSNEVHAQPSSYNVDLYVHGVQGKIVVSVFGAQNPGPTNYTLVRDHAVVNIFNSEVTRDVYLAVLVNDSAIFGSNQPITMPTIFFGGCELTIDDLSKINDSSTFALKIKITSSKGILASNCYGRKSADLIFNYEGPSTSNTLLCVSLSPSKDGFEKIYLQTFINGVAIISDATVSYWYFCNVDLSGDNLVSDDKSVRKGNTLIVQGQTLSDYHVTYVTTIEDNNYVVHVGYLFYLNENGIVNLPAKQAAKKVKVENCDVNVMAMMYDPYDNLDVQTDWGNWLHNEMTAINNTIHTFHYSSVKTGDEYAVNLIDRATGVQLFNRVIPQRFVLKVNGIQIIRPKGDNLNVDIDEYCDIVVNYVDVHVVFETYSGIEMTGPVFLIIGNLGSYYSVPMVQNGNYWEVDILIEEGLHEFNIAWQGGAYKALYKAFPSGHVQDGKFYLNEAEITTTIPFANSYNWVALVLDNAITGQEGIDEVNVGIGMNLAPK